MKDFVSFLVFPLFSFSVFSVFLVFLVSNREIVTIDEFSYAVHICDQNGGLDYIEYDPRNYSDAYCVNGAIFRDFYVKREEK